MKTSAVGSYPVAVMAMALLLAGTLEPTPLFELYHRTFGLGPGAISIVFAAYAGSLIPALLLLGGLSDAVGRRPAIVLAFAALALAAVLFARADSIGWLITARIVQGVAMGIGLGAAAAAIREWIPAGAATRAGFWTVIGASSGSAFGALLGGALGEYAPAPLVTPYVVYIGLLAVASAIVWRVPEPIRRRTALHRVAIVIPATIRRPFLVAAAQSIIGWAGFALFIALVPTYLARSLGLRNLVVGGAVITLLQIGSCGGSLVVRRFSNRTAILVAMSLLGCGTWLLIAGVHVHNDVAVALASLIAGAGGGISYLAGLNVVNAVAPIEHRAELLSAYLVACYLGFSGPALGIGLAAARVGLVAAFAGGAVVLGVIAVAIMLVTTDANLRAPETSSHPSTGSG